MRKSTIFLPPIFILSRLKYLGKFLFIGSIIFAFISVIMYISLNSFNSDIEFNSKERMGIKYINTLRVFFHSLANDSKDINQSIKEVDKIDATLGQRLNTKEQWSQLKNSKAEQINGIISLISHIGDTSNLILDPALDSFYLMDSTVNNLPKIIQNSLELKGNLKELPQSLSEGQKIELISLSTQIKLALMEEKKGLDVVYKTNPSLQPKIDSLKKDVINKFQYSLLLLNNDLLSQDQVNPNVIEEISRGIDDAVESSFKLHASHSETLEKIVQERIDQIIVRKNIMLIAFLLGILLSLYLFVSLYLSIKDNLFLIETKLNKVRQGDLQAKIQINTKDEVQELGNHFNQVIEEFRQIVANNKLTADQVANSSQELSTITEEASMTAEQVSKNMQSIAAGVDNTFVQANNASTKVIQLSAGIEQAATNALSVSDNARKVSQYAKEGNVEITKAINKMNSVGSKVESLAKDVTNLGGRSKEIGTIVEVINSIASETNLLALNAAIEAARAGEQGRGFAVVAEEVRKLAEESSLASKQISELIIEVQTSTQKVVLSTESRAAEIQEGIEVVGQAGSSFQGILRDVESIASQIQEISTAMEQMAAGVNNLAEIVSKLEENAKISQGNTQEISAAVQEQSASLEGLVSSSETLANMAYKLQTIVSKFRV